MAARAGTAPYWRTVPSSSRTFGPNDSVPVTASRTKCRSCGPLSAKPCTWVQGCQPSSPETSTTSGSSGGSTGVRLTVNRCPATPSVTPSVSDRTVRAFTASTVPPTVNAWAPRSRGEEV